MTELAFQNTGLYGILDTGYVDPENLGNVAKRMIDGGCCLIQYRDKSSSVSKILKNGERLRKLIPSGVIFILNDYVDLVSQIGADGVHLGQGDSPVEEARKKLGFEKIIGLSTHSLAQALATKERPVDYIGFGPIYRTKTKPLSEPTGFGYIAKIKENIRHPVFAIGGINLDNVGTVLEAGADGVTVVSAVLESSNVAKTVADFITKIQKIKSQVQYV